MNPEVFIPSIGELPNLIDVRNFTNSGQTYRKQLYFTANVTVDEEGICGRCECSNCKNSINPFDKYCRFCGAKSKGRNVHELV